MCNRLADKTRLARIAVEHHPDRLRHCDRQRNTRQAGTATDIERLTAILQPGHKRKTVEQVVRQHLRQAANCGQIVNLGPFFEQVKILEQLIVLGLLERKLERVSACAKFAGEIHSGCLSNLVLMPFEVHQQQ